MSDTIGFILCAGFGTRMGDLTKSTPKPMLSVSGKPVLHYSLLNLKKAGVKDVVINLHYLPEQITEFAKDGSEYGLNISYSYEKDPRGTAGALYEVKEKLQTYKNILCLYGDIFTNQDLLELKKFHEKNEALLTFVHHQREKSNSLCQMSSDGKVLKFYERPSEEELKIINIQSPYAVNSALYCLSPEVLNLVEEKHYLDFPKHVFPEIMNLGKLYSMPLTGKRVAIDGPERLKLANEIYSQSENFL